MMQRLAMLVIWVGCLIAALVGLAWMLAAAMADPRSRRAWRIAEGLDQTANAAFGGSEDMTLSARAGFELERATPPTWARWLCHVLHSIDPDHCPKSAAAHRHDIAARHQELYGHHCAKSAGV